MKKDDLTIDEGNVQFKFESRLAKESFLASIIKMNEKAELIKSQNLTCGSCAAYLCFRDVSSEDRAGLCYQEVRECRQECDYFQQHLGSGKAPFFIITGTCRRDNSRVIYEDVCKFE